MDSKDRPGQNLPSVPLRITGGRPTVIEPVPPDAEAGPSRSVNVVRAAFRAVTRHWWQILLLWGVATGGICYLIKARITPLYESVSLLKVEPSNRDLFGTGTHAGESFGPFLETQVQLLLSPNVLAAVLADPRVAAQPSLRGSADPEAALRSLLQVGTVPNSYLLRVSMISPVPAECAAIVNAVVKSYLAAAAEWSDGMTRAQIKSLEVYQRDLQVQADEKQETWMAIASKGNVDLDLTKVAAGDGRSPASARSRLTLDEYKRVRDDLFRVSVELSQAEALLSMREQEFASRGPDARPERRVAPHVRQDPELVALGQQVDRAAARLEEVMRLTRSPGDPSRVEAQKRLQALRERQRRLTLQKQEEALAAQEGTVAVVGAEPGEPAELRSARVQVNALRVTKESYEKLLGKIEVTNREEGSDHVRVALVREALDGIKLMQDSVNKRLEQLRFESKGETRISKVSEARLSGVPVSDNRGKYLAATPVAVLGLLLSVFVMLEVKVGRVSDLDDFSKAIPIEVFALPPLPGPRLDPGQRGARERETRLLEFLQGLDHLRAALMESHAPGGAGRCVIITSATEAEGKTTLSAQLAACCGKAGISTLLIDGDMRRCTLSRMLNEGKTPGLSDLLQGELAAEDAAVAIADAGFHLVAAGTSTRDPSWLLKGDQVGRLLGRFRQLFDMVIIDTPPVLPVPDALTLGRWSDGAVLASMFDFSRMALVERARRRMHSAGIPVLKSVVNGVRTHRFSRNYGYGSYNGYGSYGAYDSRPAETSDPSAVSKLT